MKRSPLKRGGPLVRRTPANLLHLCAMCHAYIHDNPAESYERGWLKRGGAA